MKGTVGEGTIPELFEGHLVNYVSVSMLNANPSKRNHIMIFDRYEFPMELDLDKNNRKHFSPESDKSIRNLFTLYSLSIVFVHSGGGAHGGHYYAFIRPGFSSKWLKFNDERVTEVDVKTTVEERNYSQ